MTKSEEIAHFIDETGGVATSAQLKEAGFLPGSISYALEAGAIDKLTRSVYCSSDVFDDEFAAISYRWRKCVFSHGSALYLAGLSDRVPSSLDVTMPRGYNPRKLFEEFSDVRAHWVPQKVYAQGQATVRSPGGAPVRAYRAPRAVADLIAQRASGGADPQLVKDAIAGYFKRDDADLSELARMCSLLGVEDEFRMYMEVLG